jgi:integrase
MIDAIDLTGLAELLKLLPQPMPWGNFKELVLPAFTAPLVCASYAARVRQVIGQVEALNLAGDGEPERHIASTADLTPLLVSRFVAALPPGWSPFTVRDRLMCLSRLCELAVEARCLMVNPFHFRPIRRIVRVGKPRDQRALSRDEVRRMFEVLRGDVERSKGWRQWKARRLLAAFALVALTGIRRNELLLMHVADVDMEARVIRLVGRAPFGKGLKTEGSAKPVGMPLALVPIVGDWLEHRLEAPAGYPIDAACPWMIPNCRRTGPWTGGRQDLTPLGRLQAVGRRAGVPDVTWRALRRSLATRMEHCGAGGSMIQRQLRHSDPETTRRHYIKADEAAIAEAMRDVDF